MVETKKRGKIAPLPAFFSALGLVFTVIGIIVSDLSLTVWAAFLFIGLLPDALLRHISLMVFRRFCLLAVGVLGYYVGSDFLARAIMLMGGVAGLVDAVRLLIRRDL